ncbi:MAG: RhuM family protein [Sulfurovum sp.]|nr:RhuM family protein [Sulfurovum sp.]
MRKIGNSDFSTKPTNFYNLDVIISVGYRVKSLQGTKFRYSFSTSSLGMRTVTKTTNTVQDSLN